jgi:hypothetical protein
MRELRLDRSASDLQRPQVVLLVLFAVIARGVCWFRRPPDMSIFLEPWFNHIVHYGPIAAFAHPFSNYEPAYLYLLALGSLAHGLFAPMMIIKIISVLGTLFLTLAFADLLKAAGVKGRYALLLPVLPSIVFNDALFAQCDALWAGACTFALAAMIRGRTLSSMIWCGVAIAFKAQAAFFAPVMIGAMIGRRAPWWQWPVPALLFLATLLPAWLQGWPATKLLTVYFEQAKLDQIPGRLGNPWMFGTIFAEHSAHHLFFLGYLAAAAAALAIAALAYRAARDPKQLILLTAIAGTALPFLLPKMLERYYFLGDVMTLALALTWSSREASIAVRAVQLASILSTLTYIHFYHHPYLARGGTACAAVGLIAMCRLAAPDLKAGIASLRGVLTGAFKRQARSLPNFGKEVG